jgi:hypothetical protein
MLSSIFFILYVRKENVANVREASEEITWHVG